MLKGIEAREGKALFFIMSSEKRLICVTYRELCYTCDTPEAFLMPWNALAARYRNGHTARIADMA
jgi:hypothetical protein